jgi:hypothetical protein
LIAIYYLCRFSIGVCIAFLTGLSLILRHTNKASR